MLRNLLSYFSFCKFVKYVGTAFYRKMKDANCFQILEGTVLINPDGRSQIGGISFVCCK